MRELYTWKTMAKCLLFLVVYAFLIQGAYAKVNCFKETVCIETVRGDGVVDFQVENLKTFDVTITITMNAENMLLPEELPYTETISAKSAIKMFRISVKDRNKSSKYGYHIDWTRGSKYAEHDEAYVYKLPYATGSFYRISQGYNERFSHNESSRFAVDFSMHEGTPVHAAREGRVVDVRAFNDIGGPTQDFADYSNYIIIQHSDGTLGEYHHLQKNGVEVSIGESVLKGQHVGYSGNTGFSSNPHLHFGVYKSYDGNKRTSIPVKFNSTQGIISSPLKGHSYTAD